MTSPSQKKNNPSGCVLLLAVLLPIVGFALALIYLIMGRKEEAGLTAGLSALGWIGWMIINR